MDANDKIIKEILAKAGQEYAPDFLQSNVLKALESESNPVFESKPLLPRWSWALIIIGLGASLVYLNIYSSGSAPAWANLLNELQLPQADLSFSVESKLLSKIGSYAIFLIPALLLQFLYINHFMNGFKRVEVK